MSYSRIKNLLSWGAGSICIAGLGAISSAITGIVGVSTMSYLDENYLDDPERCLLEAAIMGSIGGAILSGPSFILLMADLFKCNGPLLFSAIMSVKVIELFAGGLLGYGILNVGSHSTVMSLTDTAVSFAVGTSLQVIPLAYCTFCCCIGAALNNISIEEEERNNHVEIEVIIDGAEEEQEEQEEAKQDHKQHPSYYRLGM
jgi:hypothetical protein